jgi:hypothetical protein
MSDKLSFEEKPGREATKAERDEVADAYQDVKCHEVDTTRMPQVDMNTFVMSLSSSVLVHLGEVPDPTSGETSQNLEMARHTIDILGMLEQKTKGNLTEDEANLLKNVLFELRMKFVQRC